MKNKVTLRIFLFAVLSPLFSCKLSDVKPEPQSDGDNGDSDEIAVLTNYVTTCSIDLGSNIIVNAEHYAYRDMITTTEDDVSCDILENGAVIGSYIDDVMPACFLSYHDSPISIEFVNRQGMITYPTDTGTTTVRMDCVTEDL